MPKIRKPPAAPQDEEQKPYVITQEPEPTEEITFDLSGEEPVLAPEPQESAPVINRVVEPQEPDDNALARAVEAQKRAEEIAAAAQRERDAAIRRNREQEQQLAREREDREGAEYNSVLTAIAAEQSALDKAEADYAAAAAAGDWGTASKAQREMSVASARLDRFQDAKANFDQRKEVQRTQPPQRPAPQTVEERINGLDPAAQTWLRAHPEYLTDPAKNEKIVGMHEFLTKTMGIPQFSPAYFDALDTQFGFKKEPEPTPTPQETRPAPRRSIPMTAPPSRDVPSTSGQRRNTDMTLTPEERAIARNSFGTLPGQPEMTNEQKEFLYAKNKAKLANMRANGQYHITSEERG